MMIALVEDGSPVAGWMFDPLSGRLLGDGSGRRSTPTEAERTALADATARHRPPLNTTIGVVLTDAVLTKAQATRVASIAHDGMARSISCRPSMRAA